MGYILEYVLLRTPDLRRIIGKLINVFFLILCVFFPVLGWMELTYWTRYIRVFGLTCTYFFGISRHFNSNSEIRGILASKRYHHSFSRFAMPNVSYVFSHQLQAKLCKVSDALRTKAYSYFPWPDTKVLCKRQHPLLFVFSSMFGSENYTYA